MKTNGMTRYNITGYDVILENYELGQGKIIIAGPNGNFSYYWGSMGKIPIEQFILEIQEDYFVGKLSTPSSQGEINMKKTLTNIRKYIREESELEWYQFMEAQKELRAELNGMKYITSPDIFVDKAMNITDNLYYPGLTRYEEKQFKEIVESIFMEPWHFIEYGQSTEDRILRWLFKEIRKKLKSELICGQD